MFDSTSFQKSPKVTSSIKTKQELLSFYHYSKIMKLKETNQKPNQLSLNYTISQHNSIGVRQSDHISNFECFINQNSRQHNHRQLKNQYHSQSALSKNSKNQNWLKYQENQKRIEQSLNKQKFNHSLEHKEQSITRRRIVRLSSESSLYSRPTSKLEQHLQNETLVASIHKKKSSVKEISTQNHSQADQQEFGASPNHESEQQNIQLEEYEQEEQLVQEEYQEEEEEKEEIRNTIKNVNSSLKLMTEDVIVKQVSEMEKVNKIKKQATIKLNQTKKKLKQQISSQINHQISEQTLQSQQSQLMQTQKTIENQESNRKIFNNEDYVKQILNEQLKYKQSQQQEEQLQQERLEKIKEIENEIERKKNHKEDFQYQQEEDLSEEAFIKQQQLLKQQQLQKEELDKQQIQEEENKKKQKQIDEPKMKEIEEMKKSEIAGIIKKQKTMLQETEKMDSSEKSEVKIQKQKTVLFHQQSMFAQRKLSQEEIESTHREFKRQIDESIKKQKEEEERLELEQLDFVDYMLRAKDIYGVDYDVIISLNQKFKIYSSKKMKKISKPSKELEDDDENIYFSLKKWKQINKLGSITIFGEQQFEILEAKS